MSLQSRLAALTTEIGTDVKKLSPMRFSMGPIGGNGGSVSAGANWIALPGFAYQFTTPSWWTKARVDIEGRFTSGAAAWNYALLGLHVTPAPSFRLRGDPTGPLSASQSEVIDFGYINSTAVPAVLLKGFDEMILAPDTFYQFQAMGRGQPSPGVVVWAISSLLNNLMSFELVPQPA